MVSLQAIDMLKPVRQGKSTAKPHDINREKLAVADQDRFFYPDIEYIYTLVKDGTLIQLIEEETGAINL